MASLLVQKGLLAFLREEEGLAWPEPNLVSIPFPRPLMMTSIHPLLSQPAKVGLNQQRAGVGDKEEKPDVWGHQLTVCHPALTASGPLGAFNGNCEAKLSVVPKVSGLERSQEQPPGPDPLLVPFPPKEPPPPPAPRPPVSPPATLPTAPSLPPPSQPQLQLRVSPFGLRTSPYGSSLDLSTGR